MRTLKAQGDVHKVNTKQTQDTCGSSHSYTYFKYISALIKVNKVPYDVMDGYLMTQVVIISFFVTMDWRGTK